MYFMDVHITMRQVCSFFRLIQIIVRSLVFIVLGIFLLQWICLILDPDKQYWNYGESHSSLCIKHMKMIQPMVNGSLCRMNTPYVSKLVLKIGKLWFRRFLDFYLELSTLLILMTFRLLQISKTSIK